MKNTFKHLAVILVALLASISCNAQPKITKNKTMNNSKTLIVFFSHAGENYSVGNIKVGNTKLVADEIQKLTGGDQFEIVAQKSYDMPYSKLTELAKQESENNERPPFKGKIENIDQYDTIFIGGPIWWGTYPQVMFTFFDTYNLNNKTIIPFTTHEGSGLGSVVSDLKKLYPQAKFKKAFSIYGHETRKDLSKVYSWLKALGY